MAKGSSGRYKLAPNPLSPCKKGMCQKRRAKASYNKECGDVICSVCMEHLHNVVLLLCSSHDNGCRPYMCGTSFRHSNCLDQYEKAYTEVKEDSIGSEGALLDANSAVEKSEVTKCVCPLCRGTVKGWTVVEPMRNYLNTKTRNCMHDSCSYVGNYKKLRKHVKAKHPLACPRDIDPAQERKWRRLEWERQQEVFISTIASNMPGARVSGDYAIEPHRNDFNLDEDEGGTDNAERNSRLRISVEALNFLIEMHQVRNGLDNLGRLLNADPPSAGQNAASGIGANDNDDSGVLSILADTRRSWIEAHTRVRG